MILRGLDWTDTALHILLAAFVAAVSHFLLGMDWQDSAHMGALTIIVREIAQAEEVDNKVSFVRGLMVWKWGRAKHVECWVPVGVVELMGLAMQSHLFAGFGNMM
jgi:hypothetical protein